MIITVTYDVPGWAWYRRAEALARYSSGLGITVLPVAQREFRWRNGIVLHQSWIDPLPGAPMGRVWGMVANAGLMYDYNPLCDHFPTRCASRSKNLSTARVKLPEYCGIISINPRTTDFCSSLNSNTHQLLPGVDHQTFVPMGPCRTDGRLRVGWCGKAFSEPEKWTPKGFHEILQPLRARLGNLVEWRINSRNSSNALSTEEMVEWYAGNDLLLITSSSEGTPSTLLESLSCGRAVLSTDVGIAGEIREGVRVVPSYTTAVGARQTVDRLEKEILYLLNNRTEVSLMGVEGRVEVEAEWSWKKRAPIWIRTLLENT